MNTACSNMKLACLTVQQKRKEPRDDAETEQVKIDPRRPVGSCNVRPIQHHANAQCRQKCTAMNPQRVPRSMPSWKLKTRNACDRRVSRNKASCVSVRVAGQVTARRTGCLYKTSIFFSAKSSHNDIKSVDLATYGTSESTS